LDLSLSNSLDDEEEFEEALIEIAPIIDVKKNTKTIKNNKRGKRGRPSNKKLNDSDTMNNKFNSKHDAMKSKRGRPRKSETAAKTSVMPSAVNKPGRGRPKKEVVLNKNKKSPILKKAKRGRPRKLESLSKNSSKPELKKRGRGRPRKEETNISKKVSTSSKKNFAKKTEVLSKNNSAPTLSLPLTDYRIDKGLTMPDFIKNYKAQTKYPFGEMQIGDSFKVVGEKSRERAYSAISRFERRGENKGKSFRVAVVRNGSGNITETRIWRVS
jgi:hypothetical protein